jgi:hypothetical protein
MKGAVLEHSLLEAKSAHGNNVTLNDPSTQWENV